MFGGPPPDPGFEEAFDRIFPQAFDLARGIVGEPATAEDIASEALARAYGRWSKLAWQPGLDGWVLGVAKNLATAVPVPEADKTTAGAAIEHPKPSRGRAELLDGIERQGLSLRRRRRRFQRGAVGVAAAMVVVVVLAAAVGGPGESGPDRTGIAAGAAATTIAPPMATSGPANPMTTLSTVEDATTTVLPPTRPGADAAVTTAPPEAIDPSANPFTALPSSPEPRCGNAQVVATSGAESSVYQAGETIRVTSTVRNVSGAPCYYAGYNWSATWRGPGDAVVRPVETIHADGLELVAMQPGETLSRSDEWDQCVGVDSGGCTQAAPGIYAVTVAWTVGGPPVEATAAFTINAS